MQPAQGAGTHGGRRPGSGPKPKPQSVAKRAGKLAYRLNSTTVRALDALGAKAPELMAAALNSALVEGDKSTVRWLIDLLFRYAPPDTNPDSPMATLMREWSYKEQLVASKRADAGHPEPVEGEVVR